MTRFQAEKIAQGIEDMIDAKIADAQRDSSDPFSGVPHTIFKKLADALEDVDT